MIRAHDLHKSFKTKTGTVEAVALTAGGLALMAALSDAEIERTMERHADDYAQAGFTPARMAQAVRQTRKTGYADITDTLTMGVSGVGCTFAASSTTLAAISFGAITQRLPAARKKEMAQLLLAQLPR